MKKIILLISSIEEGFTYNTTLELSKKADLHIFHTNEIKHKYLIENVNYHLYKNKGFSNLSIKGLYVLIQVFSDFINSCNLLYIKKIIYNYHLFKSIYEKSDFILSEFKYVNLKSNNFRFLSFWMDDDATSLALLKKRKKILKGFSMAHGRDLFEWREPDFGILPFKRFQLKYLDKIFSVSIYGSNYLRKKYPKFNNKINVFYLGSYDFGFKKQSSEDFTIISCADIKALKRVHLIAQSLFFSNEKINWIHVGNLEYGSDKTSKKSLTNALDELKKNKNINFTFLGSIDNKSFMEIYRRQYVNLFVNVSTTEGLPFSMIEASSFGVPIISTDVGGCSEIVDQFGVVLPVNLTPKNLIEEILRFKHSKKNSQINRNKIRANWELKFNIEKNFNKLKDIID